MKLTQSLVRNTLAIALVAGLATACGGGTEPAGEAPAPEAPVEAPAGEAPADEAPAGEAPAPAESPAQ